MHASRLSFSRQLIRTMQRKQWRIRQSEQQLDAAGYGYTLYSLSTPHNRYTVVFFTHLLSDQQRSDRVISNAWDITCALCEGEISQAQLRQLQQCLPKQEAGQYASNIICISRANKSVRLFEHCLQRLSSGQQPDVNLLYDVGYLVRTTAVYGNGKFGIADYAKLAQAHDDNADFTHQFQAQMFLVYMVRQFSIDWLQRLAQLNGGVSAVPLHADNARLLGVGNSTGLGMVPYLLKHNLVINSWLQQREQALATIFQQRQLSQQTLDYWLQRAVRHFRSYSVPCPKQSQKNQQLSADLVQLIGDVAGITDWQQLWQRSQVLSLETQELLLSIVLEMHPDISDTFANFQRCEALAGGYATKSVNALLNLLHREFDWSINDDFTQADTNYYFWYQSANKGEPRLKVRDSHCDNRQMLQINVAQRMQQLYQHLRYFAEQQSQACIADFVLAKPHLTGDIERAWQLSAPPYGEIRHNILHRSTYPIDILRLKLAFFGAVKI